MPGRTTKGKAEVNRAAIYTRVLDKSQDGGDKTSIAEQIGDMEAYCESKGLTITARYQEVGRGWSKKRPEFQRMLAMPDADASTPSCAGSPTASAGTTPISTDSCFLSGKNGDDAGQRAVRLRSGEFSGLITALVLERRNRSLSEVDVRAVCNKAKVKATRCQRDCATQRRAGQSRSRCA